jgi:hypothetical protein
MLDRLTSNAYRRILWGSEFFDGNSGIIVGNLGDALRTTDAGVSWDTLLTGSTNILYDISFATRLTGTIVARDGEIYHTTDGGDTWTPQDGGTGGLSLFGVMFADSLHGIAVGEFWNCAGDHDGGATWQSQATLVVDTLLSVCAEHGLRLPWGGVDWRSTRLTVGCNGCMTRRGRPLI